MDDHEDVKLPVKTENGSGILVISQEVYDINFVIKICLVSHGKEFNLD